jgi:hypothetical protein
MKYVKLSFIFLMGITILNAQTNECSSKLDLDNIQQLNPASYQRILNLEQHTQNFINNQNNSAARLTNANATIIIPIRRCWYGKAYQQLSINIAINGTY